MKQFISSALIFMCVGLLASVTASAQVAGTCDEEQDPDECNCTAELEALGSCSIVWEEDLVSVDDPLALREAVGATTTYDEQLEHYVVQVDMSLLNEQAPVVPLHSNRGVWEDEDEVLEYLSKFLDVPLTEEGYLPAVEFRQDGAYARWDQENETWVSKNGNLYIDIITDIEGKIWLANALEKCQKTIALRDEDVDSGVSADGRLEGHQRSIADSNVQCVIGPEGELVGELFEITTTNVTSIVSWEGVFMRAEEVMDLETGATYFRYARVTADTIKGDLYQFLQGTQVGAPSFTRSDVTKVRFSESGALGRGDLAYNGTCLDSKVERDQSFVELYTEVGPTDPAICPQ